MAVKTKNYGFDKPEMNDFADVTVLGETIDKIDTALKNVEEKANDTQAIESHIKNKNNPHGVTAEQIGAVKTDLSNFDAKLINGCYIKQDATGALYRIGLDSSGLYVVKQN